MREKHKNMKMWLALKNSAIKANKASVSLHRAKQYASNAAVHLSNIRKQKTAP
jgi:hypothetical protein